MTNAENWKPVVRVTIESWYEDEKGIKHDHDKSSCRSNIELTFEEHDLRDLIIRSISGMFSHIDVSHVKILDYLKGITFHF